MESPIWIKGKSLLCCFHSDRDSVMLSLEVWQMEPEKTVNKKKINLHVNSSTTVKRRSKNFYTVQTRTSGAVSAKLLLWWNEKYPFRNAKIVVRNRTSVYYLLTRTFSLQFLHVLTQTFYTNPRTLREVLPCTFPLWELREPVGVLIQVQRLNMKNTRS